MSRKCLGYCSKYCKVCRVDVSNASSASVQVFGKNHYYNRV